MGLCLVSSPFCVTGRPIPWAIVLLFLGVLGGQGHIGIAQPTPDGPSGPDAPFDRSVLPPNVDAHEAAGTNRSDASRRVVALTNARRTEHGPSALTASSRLARIACRHNKDMLAHSYSGHEDSNGHQVGDRVAREHRTLLATGHGENVFRAWGTNTQNSDVASTVVDSWMNSPPHRKNILRPSYTHLGACVTQSGDEVRATQVFATVVGRLASPLPWALTAGDSLTTAVRAVASNLQFRRYALPHAEKEQAFDFDQTVPFRGRLRIPSTPGRYDLRMAHVDAEGNARSFQISFGPRITVQRP